MTPFQRKPNPSESCNRGTTWSWLRIAMLSGRSNAKSEMRCVKLHMIFVSSSVFVSKLCVMVSLYRLDPWCTASFWMKWVYIKTWLRNSLAQEWSGREQLSKHFISKIASRSVLAEGDLMGKKGISCFAFFLRANVVLEKYKNWRLPGDWAILSTAQR